MTEFNDHNSLPQMQISLRNWTVSLLFSVGFNYIEDIWGAHVKSYYVSVERCKMY